MSRLSLRKRLDVFTGFTKSVAKVMRLTGDTQAFFLRFVGRWSRMIEKGRSPAVRRLPAVRNLFDLLPLVPG